MIALARRDLLACSIVLVVLMVPFASFQVPHLGFALADALMMIPAGLAVLRFTAGAGAPQTHILAGLVLCVIGGVVSDTFGVDPAISMRFAVHSIITVGYAAAIVLAVRDGWPGFDGVLMRVFVLIGGVVAVEALLSAGSMKAASAGTVINGRLTGPFAQPNELGIFCAMLLPIVVVTIVGSTSRWLTVLLSASGVALAGAWALSMSRGAWMGGVAALVGLAVCEPSTRRLLRSIGALLVTTCAAAFVLPASTPVLGILGQRLQSLGDPTANQYDDRPLIWAEAFLQINSRPWLGQGTGGYEVAASDSRSPIASDTVPHPHNLVLTVLTERGVLGLAVSSLVVVGCITAARRCLQQHDVLVGVLGGGQQLRTRGLALFAALTALVVHCTLDMPLRNPIVSTLVWTVLGLAAAVEVQTATNEERWSRLVGTPDRPGTTPSRAGAR